MRSWNDDPFTRKARKEDFLARSIYKLEEIDKREHVFQAGQRVIDLGAAPGSWTQFVLKKIGQKGRIWAVDLEEVRVKDSRLETIQGDLETLDWEKFLGLESVDVVLSDLAPKTTGMHEHDVACSMDLAQAAKKIALQQLKSQGVFIVKVFMGAGFEAFVSDLRKVFRSVRILRPEGTRKHSREIYLIAKNPKSL